MTDNKTPLTDTEIKKALECCTDKYGKDCDDCPLTNYNGCMSFLYAQALDLINRLEAEVTSYMSVAEKQQSLSMERHFEIKRLKEMLDATISGQETLQKGLAEKNAEIERLNGLLAEWKTQAYKLSDSIDNIKAETTEQLSKKIESRLANNTDISNVQYQSIIFDISEACKEMVGDAG